MDTQAVDFEYFFGGLNMLPPCRVTIGKRSKELLLGESTGTDASDPIAQTSGQTGFCHSLVALRNVSDFE